MRLNKVLVVEDDALIGFEIMAALRRIDIEAVGLLGTVSAALAALKTTKFDAALLDIDLHGSPSFPVAEALKRKAIPFAFVTAHGQTVLPPGLDDAPVVLKPYEEAKLLSVTRGLLGKEG